VETLIKNVELGLELVLGLESGLGLGLGPAKVEVLLFCRSLFNLFLSDIVLSVYLRFTVSDSVFDHYNKEVIFR
jgi:hypothetical protein